MCDTHTEKNQSEHFKVKCETLNLFYIFIDNIVEGFCRVLEQILMALMMFKTMFNVVEKLFY